MSFSRLPYPSLHESIGQQQQEDQSKRFTFLFRLLCPVHPHPAAHTAVVGAPGSGPHKPQFIGNKVWPWGGVDHQELHKRAKRSGRGGGGGGLPLEPPTPSGRCKDKNCWTRERGGAGGTKTLQANSGDSTIRNERILTDSPHFGQSMASTHHGGCCTHITASHRNVRPTSSVQQQVRTTGQTGGHARK